MPRSIGFSRSCRRISSCRRAVSTSARDDPVLDQEARLHDYKRDAMLALLRANKLNRIVISGGRERELGIIAAGKILSRCPPGARRARHRRGRLPTSWACGSTRSPAPGRSSRKDLREFAQGLDKIMVVEEKRSLIEAQLREELYGSANQPVCIGKKDEKGRCAVPGHRRARFNDIAIAIGRRLLEFSPQRRACGARRASRRRCSAAHGRKTRDGRARPYFCSGCPHNTSTEVPEGMRAYAGIGCHYMVQWMDRATEGYTQMGGEGANWIGEAPFSTRSHVFQNLGDGTYNHSGSLAIRWAIAAGTNITYKILFNDAVAMTGGQQLEGGFTVPQDRPPGRGRRRQARSSSSPTSRTNISGHATGRAASTIHHRDELDAVQRELAEVPGTTVLDLRSDLRGGKAPPPQARPIPRSRQARLHQRSRLRRLRRLRHQVSNCVSVQPLETEFGRKRVIDQASCNKDFSCLEGFCPAMVTVHGAKLKARHELAARR